MKRFLARTLAAATAVIVLGGLGALGASDITPNDLIPKADRTSQPEGRANLTGDDNRDGLIDEDESGWDCHTMGNRQCGPVTGDDNGDGRIDEDESGWDCAAMGNRRCGPGAHLPRY